MADKDEDLKNLLMELEADDSNEDITIPDKPTPPPVELTDDNIKTEVFKGLSEVFNNLSVASTELTKKVQAGDTYDSTLQGLAALSNNIIAGLGKLDAMEARKDKMSHDKEMEEIKAKNKKVEIELRNQGKTPGLTTQNNYFVGDRETFFKKEKSKLLEGDGDVIDVD